MNLSIFEESLSISALPPFNFDLSAKMFAKGDGQIRRFDKGMFWQVIRIEDQIALIRVKSTNTGEKPVLIVELTTKQKPTEADKENASRTVSLRLCALIISFDDSIVSQLHRYLR